MGRPAKPSVRFNRIGLKRFPFQTVRLCLTYKGKRLYHTERENYWYGFDLTLLNSDGTFKSIPDPHPQDCEKAKKEDYLLASEDLQKTAKEAIEIAEEAERRGVWNKMTSEDLANLFGNIREYHVVMENKQKKGTLNEHERFFLRMYEWRWQQVGKGKE